MSKRIQHLEIIGIVFVLIFGILMHFIFEWSGKSIIIGTFSAVNESTWEHLKLLFFPYISYSLFEYFIYGKYIPCFLPAKAAGSLAGLFLIVVCFYTYTGIFGKNFLWMDILIYMLSDVMAFYISHKIINSINYQYLNSYAAYITAATIIFLLIFFFVLFTFFTPNLPLFQDPTTKAYGIPL